MAIRGDTSTGNRLLGNFIGTTPSGTVARGNGTGVLLDGASFNTVGGTAPGARNVIAGNRSYGVKILGISAEGNRLQGNCIGTDVSGTVSLGFTSEAGVLIDGAPTNVVGGVEPGARNVISGHNNSTGVVIRGTGAAANAVLGNYIGTSADGRAALPNLGAGVSIDGAPNAVVGGAGPGAGNVISGNTNYGVVIGPGTSGCRVEGNLIGTGANGIIPLGNGVGVWVLQAINTRVGGLAAGAGNTIAFNRSYGILVTSGSGTTIRANSIHRNAGSGISRAPAVAQPVPLVGLARLSGADQGVPFVSGSFLSSSGSPGATTYTVEFFASDGAFASNRVQGQRLVGRLTVVGVGPGPVPFLFGPGSGVSFAPVSVGDWITATATNELTGETSTFSLPVQVGRIA